MDTDTEILNAVLEFARERYDRLVRCLIARMQRIPASGIFCDEYKYKTLWDEFCHETQFGPHDLLDSAWQVTLESLVDDILRDISVSEGRLLTLAADSFAFDSESLEFTPDFVREDILRKASTVAGQRDLSRFT